MIKYDKIKVLSIMRLVISYIRDIAPMEHFYLNYILLKASNSNSIKKPCSNYLTSLTIKGELFSVFLLST